MSNSPVSLWGNVCYINKKNWIRDVIKFLLFVKNDLNIKNNGKDPSHSDAFAIVYEEISNIYSRHIPPVIDGKSTLLDRNVTVSNNANVTDSPCKHKQLTMAEIVSKGNGKMMKNGPK